jgi:hypothetical protein
LDDPHVLQREASALPQFPQNLWPDALSVPQRGQRMPSPWAKPRPSMWTVQGTVGAATSLDVGTLDDR